jgi:small subunit ribosomal protein S6
VIRARQEGNGKWLRRIGASRVADRAAPEASQTGTALSRLLVSWPGCDQTAAEAGRSSSCHGSAVTARVRRRQVNPMRQYEMMIILDPSLEERTVQPSLDQFLKVVTTAGGTVDKVDVWGRRRLAYEIDKKSEGIYTVIELKAEPETVKELDRQLNLNEAVLRTKILRPDLG